MEPLKASDRTFGMIVKYIQIIANSTPLLICAFLLEVISIVVMVNRCGRLREVSGVGGDIPDTWFGIPPDKLYNFLDELRPRGRDAYRSINSWDFMPYMESYTILFAALILRQCNAARLPPRLSLSVMITMVCDVVESFILGRSNEIFPDRLDDKIVGIASIANKLKWVSLGVEMTAFAILFLYNSFTTKKQRQL